MHRLQRLQLVIRRHVGTRPGNTPVPHGTQPNGLELANHKLYSPGDDLRYCDWNAFGRLDQLMVKTFRAEREAVLHVLIDTSASMGAPAADGKLAFATALAASLAYISLRQQDPVQIAAIGADGAVGPVSPPFRHLRRLPNIAAFLGALHPSGPTALDVGIAAYTRRLPRPGLAVVLSDFLVPPLIYQTALETLRARGCGVAALRVLGPHERAARDLPRRVRLRDSETGRERIIDLTERHRARYAAALEQHLAELKRWCEARAITFATADTAQGLEACMFSDLPRAGLVQ